jgi:hypothetical protein
MPAKTPTAWNGGWTDGMDHTYYSQALGRKVAILVKVGLKRNKPRLGIGLPNKIERQNFTKQH